MLFNLAGKPAVTAVCTPGIGRLGRMLGRAWRNRCDPLKCKLPNARRWLDPNHNVECGCAIRGPGPRCRWRRYRPHTIVARRVTGLDIRLLTLMKEQPSNEGAAQPEPRPAGNPGHRNRPRSPPWYWRGTALSQSLQRQLSRRPDHSRPLPVQTRAPVLARQRSGRRHRSARRAHRAI